MADLEHAKDFFCPHASIFFGDVYLKRTVGELIKHCRTEKLNVRVLKNIPYPFPEELQELLLS